MQSHFGKVLAPVIIALKNHVVQCDPYWLQNLANACSAIFTDSTLHCTLTMCRLHRCFTCVMPDSISYLHLFSILLAHLCIMKLFVGTVDFPAFKQAGMTIKQNQMIFGCIKTPSLSWTSYFWHSVRMFVWGCNILPDHETHQVFLSCVPKLSHNQRNI